DLYEPYVGRWSRHVARAFVPWLRVAPAKDWLEVGCGTGALTRAILDLAAPRAVMAVDPSEAFVAHARTRIPDPRVSWRVCDAQSLAIEVASVDAAVAGLVLNFLPEPALCLAQMARTVRREGAVGVYVWDYAGRMELMRYFWDAAVALDPA